jgi:L-iditol 2-dehydrogenase
MRAKQAFLHGPRDLRLTEVEIGKLRHDQVLVKLKACGICGSDVECYEGKSTEGRYDIGPYTPGHEWAGEVVDVGNGVSTLNPGYKVTGDCVMRCGVCSNCRDGLMPSACTNMREGGFRPDSPGGMGEYLVSEEQFVHRFPDAWSFEKGAWIETFSIGYFGVWGNGGYADASDDVLIMGAGPVGLSALIVAKTSGAKTIAVDPLENRRKTAQRIGADFVVDPRSGVLKEEILKLTGDRGASVIVEASGSDAAISSVFDVAGNSARVHLIGHAYGRKIPVELELAIWKTLQIAGSGGTRDFAQRTIRFMDRLSVENDVTKLITHRFKFTEIHEAFKVAEEQKATALKVMLLFD